MADRENFKGYRLEEYDDLEKDRVLHHLSKTIRQWAREKGFEEDVDRLKTLIHDYVVPQSEADKLVDFVETLFSLAQIGLITSELGELAEAIRKPRPDDHLPELPNHRVEVADTIIRLLHFDGRQQQIEEDKGINTETLDHALAAKMRKNEERPHKHGKKA